MKLPLLMLAPAALFAAALSAQTPAQTTVHADIKDATGKKLGTATFATMGTGVHITAALTGLPPGTHGLHIHNVGKCEAPAFTTAGTHFNPTNKQHGKDNPLGAHAGDLPNFDVGADGKANLSVHVAGVTLGAGPNSLFQPGGTALIIHEKADDYKTDPTGAAGNRIACGVIQK